jgi:hypothetical protein
MMFDLDKLPYDAYCKLLTTHKLYLKPFTPSTMENDLKTGNANALVFWYPDYVLKLYDLADLGISYKDYFENLNAKNYWIFTDLFADTSKKLDRLINTQLNNNILDEKKIKNGKLK